MYQDPEQIRRLLNAKDTVSDRAFDVWLPENYRRISYRFWSSVGVSMRVASWLEEAGAERVLDVGSGIGKFCVVGALGSRMAYTGVEHRPHLVALAEELAGRFGVSARVSFVTGRFDAVDFLDYDAIYLFNPFGENRFPVAEHLDSSVEVNPSRFDDEVALIERQIERMRMGTHLVTYNGFGGCVPDNFDLVHAKITSGSLLRLWRKVRSESTGGYWLELEESTELREAGDRVQTFAPTPDDEDALEDLERAWHALRN